MAVIAEILGSKKRNEISEITNMAEMNEKLPVFEKVDGIVWSVEMIENNKMVLRAKNGCKKTITVNKLGLSCAKSWLNGCYIVKIATQLVITQVTKWWLTM